MWVLFSFCCQWKLWGCGAISPGQPLEDEAEQCSFLHLLGLTLAVCSGFGVAVPSADLSCDHLTSTCHLARGFVVVFGAGFF